MHTFKHVRDKLYLTLCNIYFIYNPLYKSKHPPASNFLHTQLPRCTLPFTGIKITTQPHAATAIHWLPYSFLLCHVPFTGHIHFWPSTWLTVL